MALQKTITTAYGYEATYWKIIELNISFVTGWARVIVVGYKDSEARVDGFPNIDKREYYWKGDNFPFTVTEMNKLNNNVLIIAYNKIKERAQELDTITQNHITSESEFYDATDV